MYRQNTVRPLCHGLSPWVYSHTVKDCPQAPMTPGTPLANSPGAWVSTVSCFKHSYKNLPPQGMRDKSGLRRPKPSRKPTATGRGLNLKQIKYKEVSCH